MSDNWTTYFAFMSHEPDLLREAERDRLAKEAGGSDVYLPGDVLLLAQLAYGLRDWIEGLSGGWAGPEGSRTRESKPD